MNDLRDLSNFRGNSRWVQRGPFSFVAARKLVTGTVFRCGTDRCPARFTLKGEVVPGPVIGVHDHEPEHWIPERNEMYSRIKERCLSEVTGLQTIYEEEAFRFANAAPHLLCRNILPSMRKWRRSTQPAVPATLLAYGSAIQEHPQYGGIHIGTISAGGATAVVLAMRGFEECLQASTTVIADGTFSTVPAGLQAYQILTIHAIAQGEHYHPVIALMENRRAILYEAVLRRVWQMANNPRPAAVVTDYEPALQGALEAVVGVPAQGCFFHFMQALVKRARHERLTVARNSAGARLVKLYGALALLPPDRAEAALAELPRAAQAMGLPVHAAFHQYFRSFWMNRTLQEQEVIQYKFNVCAVRRTAKMNGNLAPQRRARPGCMVRQNIVEGNLTALERGTISLREFLVATSQAIVAVGPGLPTPAADVPEIGMEVEVGEAVELPEVLLGLL